MQGFVYSENLKNPRTGKGETQFGGKGEMEQI